MALRCYFWKIHFHATVRAVVSSSPAIYQSQTAVSTAQPTIIINISTTFHVTSHVQCRPGHMKSCHVCLDILSVKENI